MADAPQFAPRFLRFTRQHQGAFFISLVVCVISLTSYISLYFVPHPNVWLRLLADAERRTLDVRFALRGPTKPGPKVVIVAIDQKSEDVLGRWPFPRSVLADALDALREAGARVVAFDINFPQPDQNSALEALRDVETSYDRSQPKGARNTRFESRLKLLETHADNDRSFAGALARFDNAILGYFFLFSETEIQAQDRTRVKEFVSYLSFQTYPQVLHAEFAGSFNCRYCEAIGVSPNLSEFAQVAKNFGFFNVLPDDDGSVRREPVVIRFQGGYYPSLDVAATLAYTGRSLDQVAVVFNRNGLERIDLGSVSVPADPEGYVPIDFHGPAGTFPTYSLADVVERKFPAGSFRDRLVLVGPTATGIGDMVPTPFQTMAFPGVEVHANFIDNLLSDTLIRRGLRENLIDLAFILLFSLPMGMLLSAVAPTRATVILLGVLGIFLWFTQHVFSDERVWLAVFLPGATLLVNYGGIITYRYFFEEREKRRLRGSFQQYVAPAVIRQLLDRPESFQLGGEERVLTVMFADIRGFTSLSEGLAPRALVDLLNEYLSETTEVIFRHRGTLDKYVGDAIIAFWGAPYPQADHAERACLAALEMLQVVDRLQRRWQEQGRPRVDIGIGMNTGLMVVGNMGSRRRFNFTVMGDNVNLASRLEGLNKAFGTRLIASESTYHAVREKVVARELDWVRVMGKNTPVEIYELLGPAEESSRFQPLVERFRAGLEAYRCAQWGTALAIFEDLLRANPQDGPALTFLERCRVLVKQPPAAAWDGVYAAETK